MMGVSRKYETLRLRVVHAQRPCNSW